MGLVVLAKASFELRKEKEIMELLQIKCSTVPFFLKSDFYIYFFEGFAYINLGTFGFVIYPAVCQYKFVWDWPNSLSKQCLQKYREGVTPKGLL